jgi:hypothetical protein
MFALVLDGLSLSAMANAFEYDYLEDVREAGKLGHSSVQKVKETEGCDFGSRRGRDAAVELILRILGTLRTAPTTSLLRKFFDEADRRFHCEHGSSSAEVPTLTSLSAAVEDLAFWRWSNESFGQAICYLLVDVGKDVDESSLVHSRRKSRARRLPRSAWTRTRRSSRV